LRNARQTSYRDRTPFIGRERERNLLRDELARGTALLTVSGPSGIGKTRLVRHVLSEIGDRFEGGAFFCDLSTSRERRDVEAAVSRTLGLSDLHGEALTRAIGNRGAVLFVLDNLDGVARQIGPVLGNWIDGSLHLQIIATSILPVEIEGEVRFDLGPLETDDAVALYLERARRAWAGRVFTERDAPSVEELVGRLDRIPLAIELAAARVRVLPPQELLSRIDQRFEILRQRGDGETTNDRHSSLLGALQLTWDLLGEDEKRTLAKASIFEGGFTHDAAKAVIGEEDGRGIIDLLGDLRSKALLQLEESEPARFHLFESIRDFGAKELRRMGLYEETLLRHARFFAEEGEQQASRCEGPDAASATAWLQAERENLHAILVRCVEEAPDLAARAGLAASALLRAEGNASPATHHHMKITVDAARLSGDRRLLAKALGDYALIRRQGKGQKDRALLEEALALARESGDRELIADLLVHSASVAWLARSFERTRSDLEEAVAICQEVHLPLIEARALLGLGALAFEAMDFEEVDRLYERSSRIVQRHGFHRYWRLAQGWVAMLWCDQGRFRESREMLHGTLRGCREAGDRLREAIALTGISSLELAAGNFDEADRASEEALEIYRSLSDRWGEGLCLANFANAALARGELKRAETLLQEGLRSTRDRRPQTSHASMLLFAAVLEARLGNPEDARRNLEEARAVFREPSVRRFLTVAETMEGSIELAEARRLPPNQVAKRNALVRAARGRLARAKSPQAIRCASLFEAIRLLEQDLAAWEADFGAEESEGAVQALKVGPDSKWYELPGTGRVDLRRRLSLRRLLEALVERRLAAPGTALDPHELFDAGWPGVQLHPESAVSRVYLSIWKLRDSGLSEVLLNQTDGYLLDPDVPVLRQAE